MFFWDYGNAFLLEAKRAGAKVEKPGGDESGIEFRYAHYPFFIRLTVVIQVFLLPKEARSKAQLLCSE